MNFFQPSFKLASKEREGAKVKKKYRAPATPAQRLLADPRTAVQVRERLERSQAGLNPVELLHEMRLAQQRLVEIADMPIKAATGTPDTPTLETFLSGLRVARKDGEVRPTAKPKVKAKRLRRRPDPFAAAAAQMRNWFEAEPWRTGRELFERLQNSQPGAYPDGQLRTFQRRLKVWRSEIAHRMVFGAEDGAAEAGNDSRSASP